ncbi:MAG: VanW family protein [Actinomycetota bacterium]|nr:VanW family protein [Actinomycetota bacterium]
MRSYTDLPRAARLTLFIVVALFALSAITLLVFRVARSGALPGTSVAGVDVGGLGGEELRSALREAQDERGEERLKVAADDDAGAVTTTGADIGYRIDVAATSEQVLERGRQNNPVAAFADHLLATFDAITIEPVDELDNDRFDAWQKDNEDKLSTQPFPGDLEFRGMEVTPLYPEPGVVILEDELRVKALRAARAPGEDAITISTREVAASTKAADVDELAEEAEVVISDAITLDRPNGRLVLSSKELARTLVVDVIEEGQEDSLALRVKPKVLKDMVADRVAQLETEPQDASFQLSSGGVGVLPSVEGFAFAPKQTAKQILRVATKPSRTGKLQGLTVEADFTTKDARNLNITEQVSTFTTEHACCEPRVTNIHVIADMVDGVVVEPGESFSLNDFVGPRTPASGFVGAPAIRDGEFVEEIGGGISQFATTFFNTIYFGGYDFLEYQAHSYYISRYPMGREATISNPAPDLAFLNDSDAGIYIDTSYSDTSITVTFYGNVAGEVTSVSGAPYNYTEPERECRSNPDLAPGEEVVVDSGYTGFDIEVTRVFPDGREEDFFTRYNSGPLIVERRRC